jgi:hypothetical protein
MKQMNRSVAALAVVLTLGSASLIAQAPTPEVAIEPEAIQALTKMGAYLRTLKTFQVDAQVETDQVLEGGQKVQFAGVTNIVARLPDRLRVDVVNDRRNQLFLYDGKNFTLWARRVNYYATVPVPPTIGQLVDLLAEKYDIEVPLVDLFYWGVKGVMTDGITAATDVGSGTVGGVTCQHYAFRQDGLDWQIWVQKGDFPLPRKLILTDLTDEARPQHEVVYTWNLAPSFNDEAFVFDAPPEAKRIVLADSSATSPGN